jgi:DNA-binding NarL/FixJ family response regulator
MTNASPVRVLIADDHLLFAESLGLTLDIDDRLEHVGTARNGKEAVRMVEDLRPNVVLMDLDMPVMDGIEATRQLRRSFPDCQVVVLTASLAVEDAHRARSAGAAAYLTKGCFMRDVIEALLEVVLSTPHPRKEVNGLRARIAGAPGGGASAAPLAIARVFNTLSVEAVSPHQVAQP